MTRILRALRRLAFFSVLSCTAVAFAESSHLALGPIVPPPMPPKGFYLGADMGYTSRSWNDVIRLNNMNLSDEAGGFVSGLNAGYQFTPVFSAELGWFYLPTFEASANDVTLNRIESWILYMALKASKSIYGNFYALGKIGMAYNHNENEANLTFDSPINANESNYWSPYFAAGLEYQFGFNYLINFVIAYVPGLQTVSCEPNEFATPNTYLFTLGVAYKFY